MQKGFAPALAPVTPTKKASARTALVDVNDGAKTILTDCFRQFGIEALMMSGNAPERLHKEKFEACVIKLGTPEAETVMEAVRTSPSNSRMVIYGLGGSAQDAMRYSRYGINAMFHEPLERSAALKLVRATQMLVLHEFRRYVRIPVMTEVSVVTSDSRRFNATSRELSSGGMSMQAGDEVSVGQSVELSFALLTLPRTWIRATVSWRKGKTFGVHFDPQDDRRVGIRQWIDAYLES